jgi:hypothetical protein
VDTATTDGTGLGAGCVESFDSLALKKH